MECDAHAWYVAQSLRWALAGRSEAKLIALRDSLGCGNQVGVIVADVTDPASLAAMATQTSVLLANVGPFSKYGEAVLAACVECGTDYCDITGEHTWVSDMISKYDAEAKRKGVVLVPMCGFDSVPSDLAAFMVADYARTKLGKRTSQVETFFKMTGACARVPARSFSESPRTAHVVFPRHRR
jgi:short subunit dehydrogenase-like uncharacterized protein